jgi:hypothetical protein
VDLRTGSRSRRERKRVGYAGKGRNAALSLASKACLSTRQQSKLRSIHKYCMLVKSRPGEKGLRGYRDERPEAKGKIQYLQKSEVGF